MNRLKLFGLLVMGVLLIACNKDEGTLTTEDNNITTVSASIEANNSNTKAAFIKPSGTMYWQEGDALGVYTGSSFSQFTIENEDIGKTSASFSGTGTAIGYAVFPYDANASLDGSTLTYNIPASYNYTSVDTDFPTTPESTVSGNNFNTIMAGEISTDGEHNTVSLKHLGGVICIKFKGLPARSGNVTLWTDKKINGPFTVDLTNLGNSNNKPQLEASTASSDENKRITISYNNAALNTPGIFYIPVPIGTYNDVKVTLDDEIADIVIKEFGDDITIKRGELKVLEMPEYRVLTFEDADAKFREYTLDYCGRTISTWSDLVSQDQYMDNLIYDMTGAGPYTWHDEGNTELTHSFPYNYYSYAYWGGGHAISNYNSKNYTTYGNYNNQLTVYNDNAANDTDLFTTGGGHNGSNNFVVHFGYKDDSGYNGTEYLPELTFGDGVPRVIDHMWVINTCYALNKLISGESGFGGDFTPSNDSYFKIIAYGYENSNDESYSTTAEFYLLNEGGIAVKKWAKWDLSCLGKVSKVTFNIFGSDDMGGDYGLVVPAYFAYDDVCVIFEDEN